MQDVKQIVKKLWDGVLNEKYIKKDMAHSNLSLDMVQARTCNEKTFSRIKET